MKSKQKITISLTIILLVCSLRHTNLNLNLGNKTEKVEKVIEAKIAEDELTYHSMIFGGGPFYSGGLPVMNTLRASGFTTVMIWSIHVHEDGTLYLNDELIIQDGEYVGIPTWSDELATLKQEPTSVNRIEVSIGAWGCSDFENIESLIHSNGTDPNSILYRNFEVLKNVTGADAIDYDDESNYNANSTVEFSFMLIEMGLKITLCPYTYASFWKDVYDDVNAIYPNAVDRVYLQCYAGGGGNNPADWNNYFENITVTPGVWCRHSSNCNEGYYPDRVYQKMSLWNTTANITGGFLWLFDDMLSCNESTPAEYAWAINAVFIPGAVYEFEEDDPITYPQKTPWYKTYLPWIISISVVAVCLLTWGGITVFRHKPSQP